eukprot:9884182-Ditylum_brightwellii.AAC.1
MSENLNQNQRAIMATNEDPPTPGHDAPSLLLNTLSSPAAQARPDMVMAMFGTLHVQKTANSSIFENAACTRAALRQQQLEFGGHTPQVAAASHLPALTAAPHLPALTASVPVATLRPSVAPPKSSALAPPKSPIRPSVAPPKSLALAPPKSPAPMP